MAESSAYPAATAEAWIDGHVHAFAFFGGVTQNVQHAPAAPGVLKSHHKVVGNGNRLAEFRRPA